MNREGSLRHGGYQTARCFGINPFWEWSWGILGNCSPPNVSHRPVVLAMGAGVRLWWKRKGPLSNYSSSNETKREQQREFDNGHPQWNRLTCVEGGSNGLSDMQNASASMHNAPWSFCLMHDCADARWRVGQSRVVVRVTR
jgi:hypothetical protein